jgi:hypothetical protein
MKGKGKRVHYRASADGPWQKTAPMASEAAQVEAARLWGSGMFADVVVEDADALTPDEKDARWSLDAELGQAMRNIRRALTPGDVRDMRAAERRRRAYAY